MDVLDEAAAGADKAGKGKKAEEGKGGGNCGRVELWGFGTAAAAKEAAQGFLGCDSGGG